MGGKWGIFHSFRMGTFWTFRSKKIHLFFLSKPSKWPELHVPWIPMNPHIGESSWPADRIEPTLRQRWRGFENVGPSFKKHCSASKTLPATSHEHFKKKYSDRIGPAFSQRCQPVHSSGQCLPAKQGFEPHLPSVARLKLSSQSINSTQLGCLVIRYICLDMKHTNFPAT